MSGKFPVPLTPAGWAFSIWGLIFALEGWGAVYQALEAGYDADGFKVGPPGWERVGVAALLGGPACFGLGAARRQRGDARALQNGAAVPTCRLSPERGSARCCRPTAARLGAALGPREAGRLRGPTREASERLDWQEGPWAPLDPGQAMLACPTGPHPPPPTHHTTTPPHTHTLHQARTVARVLQHAAPARHGAQDVHDGNHGAQERAAQHVRHVVLVVDDAAAG